MTKQPGTVLPSKESLRLGDAHYTKQRVKALAVAKTELSAFRKVVTKGEERYYDGERRYAIVSTRDMKVRWFRVTENGDFPE